MFLLRPLPLCLLLLVFQSTSTSADIVPHLVRRAHATAVRRTHSLAHDLRIAFGGTLIPRAVPNTSNNRVVYCKSSKQGTLGGGTHGQTGGGNTGNGSNITMSSSASTAKGVTSSQTKTTTSEQPTSTVVASSPWKLTDSSRGSTFFDGWDFFTGGDPTHGIVDFLDENTARSNGLLEINAAGNAIMRVETTPTVTGNRKSIRISSQAQYNGGLVIMDAVHMPAGCGVWPAFWSDGPNWPAGGEIDIVEGVNDYTNNQATIHTNVGCTIASTSASALAISGNVIGGTNCAALTTGNQGCGIRASAATTYGSGFNSNGGGVYAMKWDTSGIAVYFFPRSSIPADITAGAPQPETWGAAQARWPAATCDPFSFFSNHNAIFDTTLCGDWAGGVWTATGIPGQEQSCAQRTGFPTCEAFVRASGSSMAQAYWEVQSVEIYELQN